MSREFCSAIARFRGGAAGSGACSGGPERAGGTERVSGSQKPAGRRRSLASVVRDVDAILQGLSAATAGLPATLPPTSEPTKEFVARQHTKLAPYKPHAPGASSSFHDALSPGGADPLKERADDLLRAMV